MDVKNFFQKILSSNKGTNIPETVKTTFNNQFDNPLNTEWGKVGDCFEAVFYKDELEHIARYQANGVRLSLKINLPMEAVPEIIHETARPHGELMNAIVIHSQNKIKYELIVRDEKLTRYFLLVDTTGEVLEKENL